MNGTQLKNYASVHNELAYRLFHLFYWHKIIINTVPFVIFLTMIWVGKALLQLKYKKIEVFYIKQMLLAKSRCESEKVSYMFERVQCFDQLGKVSIQKKAE